MYNTDVVCVYTDLESYQNMLLCILDTDLDGMTLRIQDLYDQVKHHAQIHSLLHKMKSAWSLEYSFYLLFCYDYFEHTHRFMCELLTNRPLTTYEPLYALLK